MANAKPEASAEETSDEQELGPDTLDLEGLKQRGDIDGLLALARAYRSGSAPGGRDMKKCLDAYRAAADLGSAEAEYAVALFCMNGAAFVPQDLKEGTTRLRSAAEKGSVPAKVYLGNLYELGIHYKADPEKADVWYRNAARGARIDSEPGSDEHARALADLGCVRHVLALVESGAVQGDEKTRLLQRARSHGYGLKIREGVVADDRGTMPPGFSQVPAEPSVGAPPAERTRTSTTPESKAGRLRQEARRADTDPPKTKEKEKEKTEGPTQTSLALAAFGYAILFAVTGVGAGYAATLGAHELATHGHLLPGLGTRTDLVFPLALLLFGVLPSVLVYRFFTVLKALVLAAVFGGIGWIAWGTSQVALHSNRGLQAIAFALCAFLAGLLVFGLLGGTKKQPPRQRARKVGTPASK
jgi:hypothetical protein